MRTMFSFNPENLFFLLVRVPWLLTKQQGRTAHLRGWFGSLVAVQGDLPVMTAESRH